MKGYREEIPKAEFHKILCDAFRVDRIHSEYGMAELTSQAYSQGGNIFRCPAWMRVAARDVNDPFDRLPAAPAAVWTSPTWLRGGRAPSSRPKT